MTIFKLKDILEEVLSENLPENKLGNVNYEVQINNNNKIREVLINTKEDIDLGIVEWQENDIRLIISVKDKLNHYHEVAIVLNDNIIKIELDHMVYLGFDNTEYMFISQTIADLTGKRVKLNVREGYEIVLKNCNVCDTIKYFNTNKSYENINIEKLKQNIMEYFNIEGEKESLIHQREEIKDMIIRRMVTASYPYFYKDSVDSTKYINNIIDLYKMYNANCFNISYGDNSHDEVILRYSFITFKIVVRMQKPIYDNNFVIYDNGTIQYFKEMNEIVTEGEKNILIHYNVGEFEVFVTF